MYAFHRSLNLYLICISVTLIGVIFFALQKEWLILQWPVKIELTTHIQCYKKGCKLFYWNQDSLQQERIELIWSQQEQANIHYLVNALLIFLYDEDLLQKKVQAETTIISPSGAELLISFDRNPFIKQQSIKEKLVLIDALLKTIQAHASTNMVRFLVRHKPLHDPHLDFSYSWPIEGFLS